MEISSDAKFTVMFVFVCYDLRLSTSGGRDREANMSLWT